MAHTMKEYLASINIGRVMECPCINSSLDIDDLNSDWTAIHVQLWAQRHLYEESCEECRRDIYLHDDGVCPQREILNMER
jgi:hypothetical protein